MADILSIRMTNEGRIDMSVRFNRTGAAILTGAMAALMVPAAPAMAQGGEIVIRGLPEGTRMEVVNYADLNLRYIHDLNKLNDRVGRAVRNVCDFVPRDSLNRGYRNCAESAWAGARPQMHRAYLRANGLAYR